MINFYEFVPEENNYFNRDNAVIKHPARVLIVGASGTGKTNFLLNLINHMNCFEKYYLFIRMLGNDPLYDQVLKPRLEGCGVKHSVQVLMEYSNTLDDLPDIEEVDSNHQNLFVFDDMMDEKSKDLSKISAYFTKMRKKNCTLVFISQDYFRTPKIIRGNCDTIVITGISSKKDLQLIYQDISNGEPFDNFRELVDRSTGNNGVFVKSSGKYLINQNWK